MQQNRVYMETIEEKIATLIRLGRARAWKSVDEIMLETYRDVAVLMGGEEKRTGAAMKFRGALEGVSALTLNEISEHASHPDDLDAVLFDAHLHNRRSGFTGFHRMSMENVRTRYPNAFEPWSEDEDMRLRKMKDEGWPVRDIASVLKRHPHAVTLRLQTFLKK